RGGLVAAFGLVLIAAFASYRAADPSWNTAAAGPAHNLLGPTGAKLADAGIQSLGLAAWVAAALMVVSGLGRVSQRDPAATRGRLRLRALIGALGVLALAALAALAGAVGLGAHDLAAAASAAAENFRRSPDADLPTTPVARRRA